MLHRTTIEWTGIAVSVKYRNCHTNDTTRMYAHIAIMGNALMCSSERIKLSKIEIMSNANKCEYGMKKNRTSHSWHGNNCDCIQCDEQGVRCFVCFLMFSHISQNFARYEQK